MVCCNFKSFFLFLIKWIKFFSKFLTDKFLSFIACGDASGKPPLLEIITAHPQLDASRAVLPKGSLILEQTTAIDDFLNHFITDECFKKPSNLNPLWLIVYFSLGSSPIIIDFHSGNLSRTLLTALINISKPLDLFNLQQIL